MFRLDNKVAVLSERRSDRWIDRIRWQSRRKGRYCSRGMQKLKDTAIRLKQKLDQSWVLSGGCQCRRECGRFGK